MERVALVAEMAFLTALTHRMREDQSNKVFVVAEVAVVAVVAVVMALVVIMTTMVSAIVVIEGSTSTRKDARKTPMTRTPLVFLNKESAIRSYRKKLASNRVMHRWAAARTTPARAREPTKT